MADYQPPDWLDPATMEWCAQALGGVAAHLMKRWPDAGERRIGVEAAEGTIRAYLHMVRDRPAAHPLPAPTHLRLVK